MGAKQSKRSVDISGKEGEGGGEVAAAGAGGEGRVEQLADSDALKPQLNGDAHIQHEQTDKEKELDSGTPENEKDATTEKETKDEVEDKEAVPVTNGETEQKVENGESTPTPEDGKKPKKEKVKKKWSLRSISFSRKDKPKQEKKQKEEEPKTNGEPEKVPEETAAEASPETTTHEVVEEAKASVEEKDEKTPETPVTEPLTNGSSTPESVKVETPPAEEPSPPAEPIPEAKPEPEPAPAPVPEPIPEPEQLPVNGLSLEDTKPETPAVEKPEEPKAEQPVTESVEAPAPEIPKEVCVEQMPLLEPTPPPLPANPPPSSVASFAASTMAPELTDASLANTADAAIAPISALPDTKDILDTQVEPPTSVNVIETLENKLAAPLKETTEEVPAAVAFTEPETDKAPVTCEEDSFKVNDAPVDESVIIKTSEQNIVTESPVSAPEPVQAEVQNEHIEEPIKIETLNIEPSDDKVDIEVDVEPTVVKTPEVESTLIEKPEVVPTVIDNIATTNEVLEIEEVKNNTESLPVEMETDVSNSTPIVSATSPEIEPIAMPEPVDMPVPEDIPEPESNHEVSEDLSLPPPPMEEDDDAATSLETDEKVDECLKQIPEPIAEDISGANGEMTNGVHDVSPDGTVANSNKKAVSAKCNGEEEVPAASPACAAHTPQEPMSVSDKLADLIPEIPDVPELKTETLQESAADVAVAN